MPTQYSRTDLLTSGLYFEIGRLLLSLAEGKCIVGYLAVDMYQRIPVTNDQEGKKHENEEWVYTQKEQLLPPTQPSPSEPGNQWKPKEVMDYFKFEEEQTESTKAKVSERSHGSNQYSNTPKAAQLSKI